MEEGSYRKFNFARFTQYYIFNYSYRNHLLRNQVYETHGKTFRRKITS